MTSRRALILAFITSLGFLATGPDLRAQCIPVETPQLPSPDAAANDAFGFSMAISGDTIIVGAPSDDTVRGTDTGSALIYTKFGGIWYFITKLVGADSLTADLFGGTVAIDGDTAVVGAYLDDTSGGMNSGSAYVFVRSGATWVQQAQIFPPDGMPTDGFGNPIALHGDTLMIGSATDLPVGSDCGGVYVYTRTGSSWAFSTKITPADLQAGDLFGYSISLRGNRALIGARGDTSPVGVLTGTAYVYVRSGGAWVQEAKLFAPDGATFDLFGTTVALDDDGAEAFVSATWDDISGVTEAGSVHHFTRTGTAWTHQGMLRAPELAQFAEFGRSITLDRDFLVIGAGHILSPSFTSGAAHIFRRSGASWIHDNRVLPADGAAMDNFGASLALAHGFLFVGVGGDDIPGGANAGTVRRYQLPVARVLTDPASVLADAGDAAAFSVTAATSASPAYQWRRDGSPLTNGGAISGADTATLSINPVGLADVGSYDCVLAAPCGGDTSAGAFLAVRPGSGTCPGDIDGDGVVGLSDIARVVKNWATMCE